MGVHAVEAFMLVVALATGFLLFSPALRLALVSGYSESIRSLHRWSGRGQVLLALVLAALWIRITMGTGVGVDANGSWRIWRLGHVVFVAGVALGFAVTGIVMSSPTSYSLSVIDYSMTIHLWLTNVSCLVVIVHAFLALAHPHRRQIFPSTGIAEDGSGSSRQVAR